VGIRIGEENVGKEIYGFDMVLSVNAVDKTDVSYIA
jgi:hypothetical protein